MSRFQPYGDVDRWCEHGDDCDDIGHHRYRCECKDCCSVIVGRIRLSQAHSGPLAAWAEYITTTKPLDPEPLSPSLDTHRGR